MNTRADRNLKMNQPGNVAVERLNDSKPIIQPTDNWWETGVTFNPAAFYLERSEVNDRIIRSLLPMRKLNDPDLRDGVVAVHYRARPENDPGSPFGRSFIGLALFTPDLRLLYRYQEPVLVPSADPEGFDSLGVEDPRVHRFGNLFYMVYCGVQADPMHNWKARLCLAISEDLLQWKKMGIMPGDTALHNNKDGVLFPDVIDGKYYLLHRPFEHNWAYEEYTIRLAQANTLNGPWMDLGEILRAYHNPRMLASWVGAGCVPIQVAKNRYIEIYHTGNYINEKDREYDIGAAIFDFRSLEPGSPASIVTARLEPLMVPETPAERHSRSSLQVGNVLFATGSYVYREWIYIIYGGADTYTLGARVKLETLLSNLEKSGLENPFKQ